MPPASATSHAPAPQPAIDAASLPHPSDASRRRAQARSAPAAASLGQSCLDFAEPQDAIAEGRPPAASGACAPTTRFDRPPIEPGRCVRRRSPSISHETLTRAQRDELHAAVLVLSRQRGWSPLTARSAREDLRRAFADLVRLGYRQLRPANVTRSHLTALAQAWQGEPAHPKVPPASRALSQRRWVALVGLCEVNGRLQAAPAFRDVWPAERQRGDTAPDSVTARSPGRVPHRPPARRLEERLRALAPAEWTRLATDLVEERRGRRLAVALLEMVREFPLTLQEAMRIRPRYDLIVAPDRVRVALDRAGRWSMLDVAGEPARRAARHAIEVVDDLGVERLCWSYDGLGTAATRIKAYRRVADMLRRALARDDAARRAGT